MPLENELVIAADDLDRLLTMLADPGPGKNYPDEITEFLARMEARLHSERQPAEAEVVPLPPGRWGRIELPGRRDHTGWCNEELRYGCQMLIVRDWDGGELAAVAMGPACQVVYLPTPLHRPEPARQQRALPAGDSYVWYGDDTDPDAEF